MKNILGTTKDLELFHKNNGHRAYSFLAISNGFSCEQTYDEQGKQLTFKGSDGYSCEYTYDEKGNELTFKNSSGFSCEYTYDEQGKRLTFKDSSGYYQIKGKAVTKEEYESFINGTPEYTMEELVSKLGHNFKIKK